MVKRMIKFISKPNYEQQKAFLKFQIFRKNKYYFNFIVIVFGLIFFIFMLLSKNYILAIATGILLLINIFMIVYTIYKIYRINLFEKDFSNVSVLLVEIDYDTINVTVQDTNENIKIPFNQLVSICDIKDYVFFYLSPEQAICLNKADLIEGNLDEFFQNMDFVTKQKKYRKYYHHKQ